MRKMNILVVNRPLKDGEQSVKDIFMVYGLKYNLIMFPPKVNDPVCKMRLVTFNPNIIDDLDKSLSMKITCEQDVEGRFFDFDLAGIDEDLFYDKLSHEFDIILCSLSEVEKK